MRSFGFVLTLVAALAASPLAAGVAIPTPAPGANETPLDSAGDTATDALLDCYDKFHGAEAGAPTIGPPHLSRTPDGYLLRADFARAAGAGVDRLVCWNGGFITQKDLQVPPLDPPGTTRPDAGTQRAIDGRALRRQAGADRRAATPQAPPPDAQTVRLLEGVWIMGAKPDEGTCLHHAYNNNQFEFDFEKSGGRMLFFEPPDLFSPVQIAGVEKHGDILQIQGRLRDGGLDVLLRLKVLASDRMQIVPPDNAPSGGQPVVVYRCGEPDRSVTAKVSLAQLSMIAPPLTSGWAFPQEIPGVANADLCLGKIPQGVHVFDLGSVQFELYGPAHYWIFGYNVRRGKHMMVYDFVRSVTAVDDHTLKLQMQEHIEGSGGWDTPGSHGPAYELTVIDRGDAIEIPELNMRFARCGIAQSGGMHRW